MKKILVILIALVLQGCSFSSEGEMIQWGEYSESQENRLTQNNINFKVENNYIYIHEKDINKATACCS